MPSRLLRILPGCAAAMVLLTACQPIQRSTFEDAAAAPVDSPPVVLPVLETQTVVDMEEPPNGERLGDPDDPAIWLHPDDPALSLVITSLKEGGLDVYDLDGAVLQSEQPDGARYNNVDLIYGFNLGGEFVDLAIFSDRYKDNLAVYRINPDTRLLEPVSDPAAPLLFTPQGQESDETTTAYGLATFTDAATGRAFAWVNRRETGTVALFELLDNGKGQVTYAPVRAFDLPVPEGGELENAQTEGMVVDPFLGVLYVGQEQVGLWRTAAGPDASDAPVLLEAVGDRLQADVEGLTLYFGPGDAGYLLVSSQGDNTFHVYTRAGNEYVGAFVVGDNGEIDAAEESDGAHVLNVALGDRYPQGLLVVQDGQNLPEVLVEDDGQMENAAGSFKFVPWQDVAAAFNPPLLIDATSYSPRSE